MSGWLRLRFETDILATLPDDQASVEALRLIRDDFDDEQRVVVVIENEDGVFEEDAAELAEALTEGLPGAQLEYRSRFEDEPEEAAATIASLWSQEDPARVAEMVAMLSSEEKTEARLEAAKKTLRFSMDAELVTRTAYDPLGFLELSALSEVMDSGFDYASEDERIRLLFITNPELGLGYREQAEWVEQVRGALPDWEERGFTFELTGGPVYGAEIGGGMEHDMSGTVTATAILVALLFLIIQRDLRQLALLGLVLILTFALTLGLGGWILGSLNLVSAGFAAILLGLVIDYIMIIARETRPGISAGELRGKLWPGIVWAAATTSAVFGVLSLSSFPGVWQLGGLVVIGLLTGAAISLWLGPLILVRLPVKEWTSPRWTFFLPSRFAGWGLLVMALFAGGVFAFVGLPKMTFQTSMALPKTSEAARAFAKIQNNFPAWSDLNWNLVTQADSHEELRERAIEAGKTLADLQEQGVILEYQWPLSLIPKVENFEKNEEAWTSLQGRREGILAQLEKAGFSESGQAFSGLVLERLPQAADAPNDLSALFTVTMPDGREVFAGRMLLAAEESGSEILATFDGASAGTTATGWAAVQEVLSPMVKNDFEFLFLPAAGVLLLALLLVFRCWWEALVPALVMVVALFSVGALSVLMGVEWNFLNGMAIPLIVGTGVDYGIHLIFALRRSGGHLGEVWQGVGKAICFCGLSSAIGFGSLFFASNELLASMGLLCGAGVLLTMTLSLLVVPGLWLGLGKRFGKGQSQFEAGPAGHSGNE